MLTGWHSRICCRPNLPFQIRHIQPHRGRVGHLLTRHSRPDAMVGSPRAAAYIPMADNPIFLRDLACSSSCPPRHILRLICLAPTPFMHSPFNTQPLHAQPPSPALPETPQPTVTISPSPHYASTTPPCLSPAASGLGKEARRGSIYTRCISGQSDICIEDRCVGTNGRVTRAGT